MDAHVSHDALVSELVEAFAAEQPLVERLTRAVGGPITVWLSHALDIQGTLLRVGRDHMWIADRSGFWVVASDQAEVVLGVQHPYSGIDELASQDQLPLPGLGSALREVRHARRSVSLLVGSRWIAGQLTFVGKDFLDVEGAIVAFARIRACRVWY